MHSGEIGIFGGQNLQNWPFSEKEDGKKKRGRKNKNLTFLLFQRFFFFRGHLRKNNNVSCFCRFWDIFLGAVDRSRVLKVGYFGHCSPKILKDRFRAGKRMIGVEN